MATAPGASTEMGTVFPFSAISGVVKLIPPLVIPSILISGMSLTTVSLGDTFTIDYTLENTGTSASSAGLLRVVGVANNLVFTEVSVPSIDPGNDYSGTVEFPSWEYSQTIDIEFIWNMGDLDAKNQIVFYINF